MFKLPICYRSNRKPRQGEKLDLSWKDFPEVWRLPWRFEVKGRQWGKNGGSGLEEEQEEGRSPQSTWLVQNHVSIPSQTSVKLLDVRSSHLGTRGQEVWARTAWCLSSLSRCLVDLGLGPMYAAQAQYSFWCMILLRKEKSHSLLLFGQHPSRVWGQVLRLSPPCPDFTASDYLIMVHGTKNSCLGWDLGSHSTPSGYMRPVNFPVWASVSSSVNWRQ